MLTIRKATEADAEAIVRSWAEMMAVQAQFDSFFEMNPDAAQIYAGFTGQNIGKPGTLVLVADLDGGVVGYALAECADYPPVYPRTRYAHIIEVGVTP